MCVDNSPCQVVKKLQEENQRLESEMEKLRLREENVRLRWEVEQLKMESEVGRLSALVQNLETKLEKAAEENAILKESNKQLETDHFQIGSRQKLLLRHFACISHEIRTPLNCIVGMSSLLVDTNLDGFQRESVSMINTSADLLATVVDDVLDFSKLESGDFPLDIREIDLQLAIGTVVTSIQMKADMLGRGIWIRTYLGVKLPRYIQCDSKRLQQIIYNLLGNGVKFSPDNSFIDLHLDVVESTAPVGNWWNRRLRLKIKDYGIGIHKENFARVFEPFHQESAKTCTKYGGTGLGLSVTKRLAEKLGGTVTVDSEVGKWTQFTVDLPFEEEKAVIEPYAAQIVSETAVLIVNSSPTEACPCIRWLMDVGIPVFHMFSCDDLAPTAKRLEDESRSKTLTFFTVIQDIDFCGDTFASYAEGRRTSLISFGRSNRIGPAVAYMANPCLIFPCMFLRIMDSLVKQLATGTKTTIDCSLDSSLVVFNEELVDRIGKDKESVEKVSDGLSCYKEIGLRVLIAEDNKVNQKVLKRTLIRLGLDQIDIVENGKEAYDKVHQKPDWYDIIFMDMEMPVMGGVEACRHIASARRGTLPLVIFVTAHAMDDFRSETKEAGGNGFISKPFNVGIIDKLLRSFQWDQLTRRDEAQAAKVEVLLEESATDVISFP